MYRRLSSLRYILAKELVGFYRNSSQTRQSTAHSASSFRLRAGPVELLNFGIQQWL